MAAIAKQIPKSPSPEQLQSIIPVIPHLAQVAKSMTEYLSDRDLCLPFVGLAKFYEVQGLYKQAEPWRQQCLSEAQARLSIEHPTVDVAASLHGLAMLYNNFTLPSPQSDLDRKLLKCVYNFDFLTFAKDTQERDLYLRSLQKMVFIW